MNEMNRKDVTPVRLSKMREEEAAEIFENRKKQLYRELHTLSSKKNSKNSMNTITNFIF